MTMRVVRIPALGQVPPPIASPNSAYRKEALYDTVTIPAGGEAKVAAGSGSTQGQVAPVVLPEREPIYDTEPYKDSVERARDESWCPRCALGICVEEHAKADRALPFKFSLGEAAFPSRESRDETYALANGWDRCPDGTSGRFTFVKGDWVVTSHLDYGKGNRRILWECFHRKTHAGQDRKIDAELAMLTADALEERSRRHYGG